MSTHFSTPSQQTLPLDAAHWQMLTVQSGIAPDIIGERPYRSLTAHEAAQTLPPLGFSAAVCQLGSGLLFPLTLPDDPRPLYQFRPDHPRQNAEGQAIKYEIPHNRHQRLIVHPRAMGALATGTDDVYITEGAKKVDALLSQGLTAVGVIGVYSFAVKRTAAEKKRGTPKVLLPDWQRIELAGRRVVLVYDSDADENTQVAQAEHELAALLRAQKAEVCYVRLPPQSNGSKQGVDDFLAHGATVADLCALIQPVPRPRFETISAQALYDKVIPPARWVIRNKLPVGATLFFGRGKDGKSLLVWGLAVAVATGGIALGAYPVAQGEVLYLALEDGERRAQERLIEQMLNAGMQGPPVGLDIVPWTAPRIGEGFMERLETWVDEHPDGRLVIIDILEKIRPPRTRDGMYKDDYLALEALQQFGQRHNIAVLVVHHSNKSKPEDFRDSVNGSMGLIGACDTIWNLQRTAGAPDAILKMTGRDIEPQDVALQFKDGFWTSLGGLEAFKVSKESQEVLDVLTTCTPPPLAPKHIAALLNLPVGTIRARLKRMFSRGEVLNTGMGYFVPQTQASSLAQESRREREGREKNDVTAVTPVTGVTGVTGVTLDQRDIQTLPPEALQALQGVTGGGVTPFVAVTHEKNATYSNGIASVTPVTGDMAHTGMGLTSEPSLDAPVPCTVCAGIERWDDKGTLRCVVCWPQGPGIPDRCPQGEAHTWYATNDFYRCGVCDHKTEGRPEDFPAAVEGEWALYVSQDRVQGAPRQITKIVDVGGNVPMVTWTAEGREWFLPLASFERTFPPV